MRLTVSLTSDAVKKMMMPSAGETPGIALSVPMNPVALAMKDRTRSKFDMPIYRMEFEQGGMPAYPI